ncbi:MerR family transcriptional regulator [Gracilibacillus dipsosauri]|uniref:MerR family transcriptional regulator n=2 Tax=Gracilibacillus dipsosauri TaxID=178340 RepID=A0A317KVL1_9BACI|nr:MerR family transcriptional regulator [Gracilibacillus dipsosauri]
MVLERGIIMLTVKEAAKRVSIPTSTIRYYDKEGLLPFIERDENGYRVFKEEDLFWLELVTCMRKTKMSIGVLRHVAHLYMEGDKTLDERIKIFQDHQKKLLKQKQDVEDALEKLEIKMNILRSTS